MAAPRRDTPPRHLALRPFPITLFCLVLRLHSPHTGHSCSARSKHLCRGRGTTAMSEPGDPLRLAELLCARMSHDLGGTIGTLAGALELTDDPAVAAEALALANQAAAELRQRLELQRASLGPDGAPLDLAALRDLAQGLPHARRCTIEFSVHAGGHSVFPAIRPRDAQSAAARGRCPERQRRGDAGRQRHRPHHRHCRPAGGLADRPRRPASPARRRPGPPCTTPARCKCR